MRSREDLMLRRLLAVAVGVGALLTPSWTFAQAAPAPRPAAPQAPAAPRQGGPPPQAPPIPPAAFQAGMKYAYIRLDLIAAASSEGRVANEKVKALNDQKVRELNDRNKALQSAQQKLDQGGGVLNDAARGQLQAEVERQTRDLQRFSEDAQQDVQALQQQLQAEFQRKLDPVIDKVAKEKQVHMVFSVADSGLVWADPGMDLTGDIIRALDATGGKPAPAAAAPAPAPAPAPAAPAAPGAK
jgi:outer membrane protein